MPLGGLERVYRHIGGGKLKVHRTLVGCTKMIFALDLRLA